MLRREIINLIPFNELILLLMILFMLITYLSARIGHAFLSRRIIDDKLGLSNTLIGVLSSGFFILLAFIIINSWTYHQEARQAALDEANDLAVILYVSKELPLENHINIKKALIDYISSLRTKEWETMREGLESVETRKKFATLYNSILSFTPTTDKQKLIYSNLNNTLNSAFRERRLRLSKTVSLIPTHLFNTVFWGAVFVSVVLGLIRGKDDFISFSPVLLFSGLLGFNIALALSFDFPFSGDLAVSNNMYAYGVLKQLSIQ